MTSPRRFLNTLFGQLSWSAPPWINRVNNFRRRRPVLFWGFPVILLAGVAAWHYYSNLPKPWLLEAEMYAPAP